MTKKNPSALSRRNLLRNSTLAGVAVAAPTIIPSSALGLSGSTAPSNRLTLGMIGCGNIMRRHFKA